MFVENLIKTCTSFAEMEAILWRKLLEKYVCKRVIEGERVRDRGRERNDEKRRGVL